MMQHTVKYNVAAHCYSTLLQHTVTAHRYSTLFHALLQHTVTHTVIHAVIHAVTAACMREGTFGMSLECPGLEGMLCQHHQQ